MKIYLIGAGNQARETITYYKAVGKYNLLTGCLEEDCNREGDRLSGIPILDFGRVESIPKDALFLSAIGVPLKQRLIDIVAQKGFCFDTMIHPSCIMNEGVKISEGCTIGPGVILTTDIRICSHVLVNANTTIHHDVEIGAFTTISGNSIICGKVKIGSSCFIGAGTTIISKITIGRGVVVGAGSVVIENVPDGVLIAGNPARQIRDIDISKFLI